MGQSDQITRGERPLFQWAVAFVLAGLGSASASDAHGAEFEVAGDVAAQGYEVISPWGGVTLGRRRLMTTLSLAGYNLQGEPRFDGPSYSVRMRLRVDADFGAESGESTWLGPESKLFLPGYDHRPVDLMYGYVQGRRLLGGWLDFRVGRQYTTDVLGWWSFDGGWARITTPFFVDAQVFGGLEQRGGFPLSTGRYAAQGVWRGSESQTGAPGSAKAMAFPSYLGRGHAPGFGVALETNGPNWIHGRLVYRRVYNTGAVWTSPFLKPGSDTLETYDETRISQERIGYAVSAFIDDIGAVRGGFAYDLYTATLNRAYGSVDVHIGPKATVGLDGETFLPTFDADSIFNWFTHHRITTAQARADLRPHPRVELTASGGIRLWMTDGDPKDYALAQCMAMSPGTTDECLKYGLDTSLSTDGNFSQDEANRETALAPDIMANIGARYRWHRGRVHLSSMLQTGVGGAAINRGRRAGGSIEGRHSFASETVWLGGRVSIYDWADPLRPHRDATSFGYVVAPEYRPFEDTRVRLEWEHNMNRLVGQRYRVLGLVSFRVLK